MPHSSTDETLLLIRCPSCNQRFKVEDNLMGRTVECGGCEHRFRITEDSIIRGKKFYPGERKDAALDRFQRVPLAAGSLSGASMQEVHYMVPPQQNLLDPVSPLRIFSGIAGVVGMLFTALLLMFAANPGGALDGMPRDNRLVLAGFIGIIGVSLLIYANPRTKIKAGMYGGLMLAGLLVLPFVFTQGSIPLGQRQSLTEEDLPPPAPKLTAEEQVFEDLRNRIGTKPLEEEILKLQMAGSKKKAYGLWLRDLREQNRYMIRDYLLRATGADPQSHFYPRDRNDFLMVLTGVDHDLEEITKLAAPIGTLTNTYPEIPVLEIRVINQNFIEPPVEQLEDVNSDDFYALNLKELNSIDLQRVGRAVKRLADSEPKVFREDVSNALMRLLRVKSEVEFKSDVCRALGVWSENPIELGMALLEMVKEQQAAKAHVPREIVIQLLKLKTPGVAPILDDLWAQKPMDWETIYGDVGTEAEPLILKRFSALDDHARRSAIRLLGRVGGRTSVSVLETAVTGSDPELKVLIENSLESIQSRLAQ